MFMKQKVGLVAVAIASMAMCGSVLAAGSTAVNTMTVDATLISGCEVPLTSAIHFGGFLALASTGDKTANSGSTFQIACSSDATPFLYADAVRVMSDGTHTLPFTLGLTSAATGMVSATGTAAGITQNGSLQTVTIYGKTLASDFKLLPAGDYTTTVALTVAY